MAAVESLATRRKNSLRLGKSSSSSEVAVGEQVSTPASISSPSVSIATPDDAGPTMASTLSRSNSAMPSRARSDELPSSALYSTTSRPSKPPLALMMLIAWSAAAMPARPMLGPNDCGSAGSAAWGSSTPMRSTPSSRWVAGSALDDGVEVAVAPSVVTALSGASAALGPPSPPEHAASVSAVAVRAAHRPNHWRRTPPTLGVEGNGDRATPITRCGAGRRAPSRAGSARPRRRARRDRRRRPTAVAEPQR